jgi:hypothetical protein
LCASVRKNTTTEPTVVHENATNEPTVVRKKHNDRTHRRSTRTLRTNPPWFTKTLRTNPPWFTKTIRTNPPWFTKTLRTNPPPPQRAWRECAERTQIPEPPASSAVRDETKPSLAISSSELVPRQRDPTTGVSCETKPIIELGDRIMDAGRRQNAPNEPNGPTMATGENAPNEPTEDCGSVTDGPRCRAGKTRRTNPPKFGRRLRTNPPGFWKTRRTNPPDDGQNCENGPGEPCLHRRLDWVAWCGQH